MMHRLIDWLSGWLCRLVGLRCDFCDDFNVPWDPEPVTVIDRRNSPQG